MKILLHICCAPCALYTVDKLRQDGHKVEGFFYNPNIYPSTEYKRRRQAVEEMAKRMNVDVRYAAILPSPRDSGERVRVRGESETRPPHLNLLRFAQDKFLPPSGGEEINNRQRCINCWRSRLTETSRSAKLGGFDAFSTTLLISPYQNHSELKITGSEAGQKAEVDFYYEDFRVGFRKSQSMAKEGGYYRQKYCGCADSKEELNNRYL